MNSSSSSSGSNNNNSSNSRRFYYVNLIVSVVSLGLVLFIFPFSPHTATTTTTPLSSSSLLRKKKGCTTTSSSSPITEEEEKSNKTMRTTEASSSTIETRRPMRTPILLLPPLSSLVNGTQVIAAANAPPSQDLLQPLLDFAIIGHPKTATTTLLHWLSTHPSIKTHHDEIHSLTKNRPADFIRRMYELQQDSDDKSSLPPQIKMLYGYKAPRDIIKPHVLDMISEYWPSTKLIVGLRHPIDWFESFYNYRIEYNHTMLPPEQLIGACTSEMSIEQRRQYFRNIGRKQPTCGVCTDDARFHVHLNMLGKVNVSDIMSDEEEGALGPPLQRRLPNKVFLYDAKQLSSDGDDDGVDTIIKTRFNAFREDLSSFLGLGEGVGQGSSPPLGSPPFSSHSKEANYNPHHKYPLDICQPQYTELRQVLLQHGKDASKWIIKYFINHPDVTVSSPEYLIQLLSEWEIDPCNN